MKIGALLFCLLAIGPSAWAAMDIEVQFELTPRQTVMKSYTEKLEAACTQLKKLPYSRGTIRCSTHLKQSDAQILIQLKQDQQEFVALTAVHTDDDTYNAGWKIKRTETGEAELDYALKLIDSYALAIENQRFTEEMMLVEASKDSPIIDLDKDYDFVDRSSRKKLSFDEARSGFREYEKRNKSWWKAALNLTFVLGMRGAYHWTNKDNQLIDWQYNFDWPSYRKKIVTFEGVSLDASTFNENALKNPIMGTFIQLGSRSFGMHFYESFLFSLGGTLIWEFLGEFNEQVSLYDIFLPPMSGAVIGEVVYRLSEYLWANKSSWVHRVFASAINPYTAFRHWREKNYPMTPENLDDLGFSKDVFHRFEFYYGQTLNQLGHYVKVETQLYYLKNYLAPVKRTRSFGTGDLTMMELEGIIGKDGVEKFRFFTYASIYGLHKQNITNKSGNKQGYSVLFSFDTSYDFSQQKYKRFFDQVALLNVLGATAEINYFYKGFHIKTSVNVSGGLGQVKSASVNKLEESHYDLQLTKYVLETQKYYFAYGMSLKNQTQISYKKFSVNSDYKLLFTQSIDGIDRYQYIVSDDFTVYDRRSYFDTYASYNFFRRFILSLGYQNNKASGDTKDISDSHAEHYFYTKFGFDF